MTFRVIQIPFIMNKTKKYILLTLLSIIGLFVLILAVAFTLQTTIHNGYGVSFNDKRAELGVYPIDEFETKENSYWSDFYPDDPLMRWINILGNTEIANMTNYYNSELNNEPYHKAKTIYFGTQLCFWQNYYGGETDLFIKPLGNDDQMELYVSYFTGDESSKSYFYYNLDTVNINYPEFICGTPDLEGEIPKGNLTKEQADSVLLEWGIYESF